MGGGGEGGWGCGWVSFDSFDGVVLPSRWIQLRTHTHKDTRSDIYFMHKRVSYILLLWLCAASTPDGHRLAVLVEASSAAVDVGVGGRRHWLLPGPDGLGCGEDEEDGGCGFKLQSQNCFRVEFVSCSPIWAECPLLAMFLALTASLMRSTSCW